MKMQETLVTHTLETRNGAKILVQGVPALLEPENPHEWSYSLEVGGHLERLILPALKQALEPGQVLELDYRESKEPPQVLSPISEVIARAIEQSGLSKAEVSRRMGVPRALLTRWTHPRYTGHTVDTLERIATALGGTLEVKIEVTRAA